MTLQTKRTSIYSAALTIAVRPSSSDLTAQYSKKHPNIPETTISSFVAFLDRIPKLKFFNPIMPQKAEWRMFNGGSLEMAWAEANHAAVSEANETNGHAAESDALRFVRDTARRTGRSGAISELSGEIWHEVWSVAGPIVGPMAPNYSRDIIRHAAWHAVMKAEYILLKDVNGPNLDKHAGYVDRNFEVWEMGRGLAYNMNGVLYVFSNEKASELPLRS